MIYDTFMNLKNMRRMRRMRLVRNALIQGKYIIKINIHFSCKL